MDTGTEVIGIGGCHAIEGITNEDNPFFLHHLTQSFQEVVLLSNE